MPLCSGEGCFDEVRARGWCNKHYLRWRNNGGPTVSRPMGPQPIPLIERRTIDPETGCWEFTGSRDGSGYGNVRYRGRVTKAHRLAAHLWLDFDLASHECILHSCDNPPCFNPAHLRVGSKADNARDMVDRDRQFVPGISGEQHWAARLSDAQIAEIRARRAAGETQTALAREYGVRQSTISRIVNGKRRAA
jgi:hypothetical protein